MSRLIDADELQEEYKKHHDGKRLLLIDVAPTVEPQRIKGRWTKAYDGHDGHVKCVQCFKTYDWDTQAQYYNFCPNCGSDNRGEEDEAD